MTVKAENIPAELKQIGQWVRWRFESRDGKATKLPYDCNGGRLASSTNPDTWGSFEAAMSGVHGYSGVGFVFSAQDDFVGVDLDGCIDEAGAIVPEAQAIINRFATYAEVSPSGRGVKLFCRGALPTGGHKKPGKTFKQIECYSEGRYFAVTGDHVPGTPTTIQDSQAAIDWLIATYFQKPKPPPPKTPPPRADTRVERCRKYISKMPDAISGQGGHDRTFAAACECYRFGLSDAEAWQVMQEFNVNKTAGESWSEKELRHKLDSAKDAVNGAGEFGCRLNERTTGGSASGYSNGQAGAGSNGQQETPAPDPAEPEQPTLSALDLVEQFPNLNPPVVDQLLRQSETMNVISASKAGKSWLVLSLAFSVVTGQPWLGRFGVRQGPVLIVDNELHANTLANRIKRVGDAMGVNLQEFGGNLQVKVLRGQLQNIYSMKSYFDAIEPGRFKMIILDAWYRFMPPGFDENDNAGMMSMYNILDAHAQRLQASFVLIHHSSKGLQSDKSVTDVGSGAGAISRSADTHMILRPHAQEDAVSVEARSRSWPQMDAFCLRWQWPLWELANDLDPTDLKRPGTRKPKVAETTQDDKPRDDLDGFIAKYLKAEPQTQELIVGRAGIAGMSKRKAVDLLAVAVADGKAYRLGSGTKNAPYQYTTKAPDLLSEAE